MAIQHDPQRSRFLVEVAGGTAELVYRRVDDRTVDLLHTTVPEAASGQGIAGQLAQAAFDWARGSGTRLVVSCPYVSRWLVRHPEQQDLVQPR
jgi:predicted GNAT family acetyltransferase